MVAWRKMTEQDLPAVLSVANKVHRSYPEDAEVFAERLALFPDGCRILENPEGVIVGYALTHPWRYGMPPKLNIRLGRIPADADTYYLHDIAMLPEARRTGASRTLIWDINTLAETQRLSSMTLVAVNDSRQVWESQGFQVVNDGAPDLRSYGGEAWYMQRPVAVTL